MNSRDKGKRGERELAKALADALGIQLRRTAQVDGGLSADLIGWPGVHIECKRYARIAVMNFMRQAIRDAKDSDIPVVLMREDRGVPVIMCRVQDLPALVERVRSVSQG